MAKTFWRTNPSWTEYSFAFNELCRKVNMKPRTVRFLKQVIISTILVLFAVFAITEGADATRIGLLTIIGLLGINGIEVGEWLAVKAQIENQRRENE